MTVIKLLFFSFSLIFATTQPSTHESISTTADTIISDTIVPRTEYTVAPATIMYTIETGSMTIPEYMSPSR